MKIYKIPDGTINVSVRLGASKHANIHDTRLEEGDKVFSQNEKNNYIQIDHIEMPGHGIDVSLRGYWIFKEWVKYAGEKDADS